MERSLGLFGGAVTALGSLLFAVAAFLPISFRVFPERSPARKLESLEAAPGEWQVAQVLFGAGAVVTVIGIALYAVAVRGEASALLVWASVVLLAAAVVPWLWHVYARATDPERFAQGQFPAWPVLVYFLVTEVGLAVLGVALLSSPLPAWVGWMLIASMALFVALTLIFRDIPPFVFYVPTLVVGVVLVFRYGTASA